MKQSTINRIIKNYEEGKTHILEIMYINYNGIPWLERLLLYVVNVKMKTENGLHGMVKL